MSLNMLLFFDDTSNRVDLVIKKIPFFLFYYSDFAGVTLGILLNRKLPEHSPQFLLCSSIAMLLVALVLHAGLEKVGVNLSW